MFQHSQFHEFMTKVTVDCYMIVEIGAVSLQLLQQMYQLRLVI